MYANVQRKMQFWVLSVYACVKEYQGACKVVDYRDPLPLLEASLPITGVAPGVLPQGEGLTESSGVCVGGRA